MAVAGDDDGGEVSRDTTGGPTVTHNSSFRASIRRRPWEHPDVPSETVRPTPILTPSGPTSASTGVQEHPGGRPCSPVGRDDGELRVSPFVSDDSYSSVVGTTGTRPSGGDVVTDKRTVVSNVPVDRSTGASRLPLLSRRTSTSVGPTTRDGPIRTFTIVGALHVPGQTGRAGVTRGRSDGRPGRGPGRST